MDVTSTVITIVGGLAFFLLGMKIMSEGLQKVAGPKMRKILGVMTGNRFAGVGTGLLVTSAVQSSSISRAASVVWSATRSGYPRTASRCGRSSSKRSKPRASPDERRSTKFPTTAPVRQPRAMSSLASVGTDSGTAASLLRTPISSG